MKIFSQLFDQSNLTPHGFCLTWDPGLIWLHAASDALTAIAYFSIPFCLFRLARGRRDEPHRPILWLFVAFIMACGGSHVMSVLTLWTPAYVLEGAIKLVTAALSICAAIALWPLVPKLMAMPSRTDVERLNSELETRIREQDRAAAALLENQTRLLLAQEAGRVGAWDWNLLSNTIHWSASQYELYGMTASDEPMTRSAWLTRLDPVAREMVTAALAIAAAGGCEYTAEFQVTLPDGRTRWLDDRGRVVANFTDGTARMVGVTTDVTERKRLTERLTRTNELLSAQAAEDVHAREIADEQLRVMFDHSPDALFVVRIDETDYQPPFAFEAVNPATERLSGKSAIDYIGFGPEQTHGADGGILLDAYRRCIVSDASITVEYEKTIEGKVRVFETSVAPVRDRRDGRAVRIIGVSRDVTERAALENQLRQLAKMEATSRLTAGIAHDFNNLLQSLMGGLEMLLLEFGEPGSREFAEVALESARRGAELTHRLLAFSRQQSLQPRAIDAGRIIHDISNLLTRTMDSNLQLVAVSPPQPVVLLADPSQLEAALVNLVINATHATAAGGRIEITADVSTPAPGLDLAEASYARLTVSDDGVGMTQAVLSQACEPFFTTKGLAGSGLGLSMVQGFARQSGGDLFIRSTLGQGTSVELFLPLAAAPGHTSSNPAHVMLVDDAQDVLVTVGGFLRHAGFVVTRMASGKQALAHLAEGLRCDVLITDYAMPDINGVELLRAARQLKPGLPALIITGFDQTAMRAQQAGARVLQKPFERRTLVDEVRSLLPCGMGDNPQERTMSVEMPAKATALAR